MDKRILLLFIILILFAAPVDAAIKACTACNSTCNTLPGINGTNGTNGVNGTSATIVINYTGTLPAGSSAGVDNIGDSLNAVFNFWIPKGDKGDTGSPGAPGADGLNNMTMNQTMNQTPGATGGYSILYRFSTTTTAPPADGFIRYNSGTPASVTTIWIEETERGGEDVAAFYATLRAGTRIKVFKENTPALFHLYNITTAVDSGNYYSLTVAEHSGSSSNFANNDNIAVGFALMGASGSSAGSGDTTQFLFLNGTRPMTGGLQMGGFNISNLLDPVAAQEAATKNYVDAVNTSMRNNVSVYSASTSYVDAVNTSMRNNISIYSVSTATLTAVNDSMRNNVSQYVIAVNNTQNINSSLINSSQTANTSAYVIAVNNSMKAYVDAKPAGGDTSQFLFLNGSRPMTGGLQMGGFNISNLLDPVAAQQAATKAYADLLNATMASNISVNHPTITFLNTVNDTMRNNVSQYVIAANNSQTLNMSLINATQNVNVSLVNTSMRNNVSAYVIAVNDTMRNNVSQYVIAVNNSQTLNMSLINATQNVNVSLVNTSMRNNVSAYVIAVNDSMRANVSTNHAGLVAGKVPTVQLGGAGADNTKFLRGDQSWQLPGAGSGDGNTYYLIALSYSPADNVANYFGANPVAGQTTVNQTPVWFYKTGTITGVTVTSYAGTAGTAETWGMYLLINGSTEYPLQNITVAGNTRVWRNSTISVAVVNGSHMQIKTRNPAWATNPLTCTYGAYVTVT